MVAPRALYRAAVMVVGALFWQSGCSAAELEFLQRDYKISVRDFGSEKAGSFCEDFRLNDGQARLFFSRAKVVSAKELHDEYDWLPCYVKGSIISAGQEYEWEIRPVGIGKLVDKSGNVWWLGCKDCDEIF